MRYCEVEECIGILEEEGYLRTASPEGDVGAIMEDMLERAKELDNEGLCLGLFTIQQIPTKHLGEGKDGKLNRANK